MLRRRFAPRPPRLGVTAANLGPVTALLGASLYKNCLIMNKFQEHLNLKLSDLIKSIQADPSLINLRSEQLEETLLHWFAVEGYMDRVQELMKLGFSLNVLNNCGNSPLTELGILQNYDGVKWLLNNGADINLWGDELGNNLVKVSANKHDEKLFEIIQPFINREINEYFDLDDASCFFFQDGALTGKFIDLGLINPTPDI